MKTQNWVQKFLVVALSVVATVGCGKQNSAINPNSNLTGGGFQPNPALNPNADPANNPHQRMDERAKNEGKKFKKPDGCADLDWAGKWKNLDENEFCGLSGTDLTLAEQKSAEVVVEEVVEEVVQVEGTDSEKNSDPAEVAPPKPPRVYIGEKTTHEPGIVDRSRTEAITASYDRESCVLTQMSGDDQEVFFVSKIEKSEDSKKNVTLVKCKDASCSDVIRQAVVLIQQ